METLNIEQLVEQYPKTGKMLTGAIKSFIEDLQKQMMVGIPMEDVEAVELPEVSESLILEYLTNSVGIGQNIELMFNLFDSEEIYMSICYDMDSSSWVYYLNNNNASSSATNRIEAIFKCIPLAFEALETKLNEKI